VPADNGGVINVKMPSSEAPKRSDAVTPVEDTARIGAKGPVLSIDNAQFGMKVGKHAGDYGLSPADPAARSWILDHIKNIHANPDEVRQGSWNPNGGGGTDYWFYRQGSDVVVTKGDGQFVTILKGGQSNGWFNGATPK